MSEERKPATTWPLVSLIGLVCAFGGWNGAQTYLMRGDFAALKEYVMASKEARLKSEVENAKEHDRHLLMIEGLRLNVAKVEQETAELRFRITQLEKVKWG